MLGKVEDLVNGEADRQPIDVAGNDVWCECGRIDEYDVADAEASGDVNLGDDPFPDARLADSCLSLFDLDVEQPQFEAVEIQFRNPKVAATLL